MACSLQLYDVQFAKQCPYFISMQIDGGKRVRTEVSAASAAPVFAKVFDLTEFEVANASGEHVLSLEAYVVLPRTEAGAFDAPQLLGTSSVQLFPDRAGAVQHSLTFLRKRENADIPVGKLRLGIQVGAAAAPQDGPAELSAAVVVKLRRAKAAESAAYRVVVSTREAEARGPLASPSAEPIWNSQLRLQLDPSSFDASTDESLRFELQAGDGEVVGAASVDLKRLVAYNAYELSLQCTDAENAVVATLYVNVAPADPTLAYARRLFVGALSLTGADGSEARRLRAVVQLVDAKHVDAVLEAWEQRPPTLPGDESLDSPLNAHRTSTLASEVADVEGVIFWKKDDEAVFALEPPEGYDGAHPSVSTYPGRAGSMALVLEVYEEASFDFIGYAVVPDVQALFTGYAVVPDVQARTRAESSPNCAFEASVLAAAVAAPPDAQSGGASPQSQGLGRSMATTLGKLRGTLRFETADDTAAAVEDARPASTLAATPRRLTPRPPQPFMAALVTETDWEAPTSSRGRRGTASRGPASPHVQASQARGEEATHLQMQVQRLVSDLEKRDDALRQCGAEIADLRRARRAAEHDASAVRQEMDRLEKQRKTDSKRLEDALGLNEAPSPRPGVRDALVDLCTRLRRENDALQVALNAAKEQMRLQAAQATDADNVSAKFAHLQKAHTTQAAFIQRLQKEHQKIEAYQTTISMQESVISKMEDLIENQLGNLRARPGKPNGKPEAKVETSLLMQAKDQRIKALQDQLIQTATSSAHEIAQLKLRLFEYQVDEPTI
ncbi:hypothetical protein M885DRAFT_621649 [Pelagophyceae sp. CCMP2097]|nr:hypothetical protein M885DRAFT_621649 [Pelagophyceae sp. CCMP2097]